MFELHQAPIKAKQKIISTCLSMVDCQISCWHIHSTSTVAGNSRLLAAAHHIIWKPWTTARGSSLRMSKELEGRYQLDSTWRGWCWLKNLECLKNREDLIVYSAFGADEKSTGCNSECFALGEISPPLFNFGCTIESYCSCDHVSASVSCLISAKPVCKTEHVTESTSKRNVKSRTNNLVKVWASTG